MDLYDDTFLGIELGSTRIKAVIIGKDYTPIAQGFHEWENRHENGYWTYSLDDIHDGVKACFASLARDYKEKFSQPLRRVGAIGISAMMHGYMAFNESGKLLAPFRTWRNTTTEMASFELTKLLSFNIPQRWSIAHLYEAVLSKEEHVSEISYITTLAVYINYLLTGRLVAGIGEASGMFPIDKDGYDAEMMKKADERLSSLGFTKKLSDVLPAVMLAGESGCTLTAEGASFLDESGELEAGIPVCPPEGDAGTGMVASNAVRVNTGNVSAGTSIFSMPVLSKPLSAVYPEIDIVTTPDGAPVAMVHCNNCCCELDAWVKVFSEFAELIGKPMDKSELYSLLYRNSLSADASKSKVCAYNFLSGEPVAKIDGGRPMYFRTAESELSLASFFKAQLMTSLASLKLGMDILADKEHIKTEKFTAHGGLFKVKGVAQQLLANALGTDVTVTETAGEGGAWGMALLAAYMVRGNGQPLADWLDTEVFSGVESTTLSPEPDGAAEFNGYMKLFEAGLSAQRTF